MEIKNQQEPKNAILDNNIFALYVDIMARSIFMLILMLILIAVVTHFYPSFKGIVLFIFVFLFSVFMSPHLRFIVVSPLIINKLRKYFYEGVKK